MSLEEALNHQSQARFDAIVKEYPSHRLTGGIFFASLVIALIHGRRYYRKFLFTDKCSCMLPIKNRCSIALTLILHQN